MIGYYEDSVFRDFIKDASRDFPNLKVQYLREYTALGTAGGLYHFRDHILKSHPERLFVINADVCCSFPLLEMLQLMEDKDAEAVILGTRLPKKIPKHFGSIVSDAHTKRVLHYVEKPESEISDLINCGVYLLSTSCIFPAIRSAIKRRSARPRLFSYPSTENIDVANNGSDEDADRHPEIIRLEQDILPELADSNRFFVHTTQNFWLPIKSASSAVPANALYLQQAHQSGSEKLVPASSQIIPPVFIDPTATVDPTAKLGPNVSIGPRVTIGPGVRIKEAIILEDSEIRHDACILNAIVGWNSRIGAWSRIEGSYLPPSTYQTTIVKNGMKVQSITILGKECIVGDEVHIDHCVCLPNKELKKVN